jgi:hypothetical protein
MPAARAMFARGGPSDDGQAHHGSGATGSRLVLGLISAYGQVERDPP